MSWRNQENHRAETKAVKEALAKANLPFLKVGHGTGTAWAWLEIFVGQNPSREEHNKLEGLISCYQPCIACLKNREICNQIISIVKDVTGRHGDYDGNINILQQEP